MSKRKKEGPWDPWDGEYIGNIWGWKFSFISLGIILFFLFIALFRYYTLTDPNTTIQTPITIDTTKNE